MQELMGNVSREMKILRTPQSAKIKNTVTEIKNAFDGLIRWLDTAEPRTSDLEVYQQNPPKLKHKENQDQKT